MRTTLAMLIGDFVFALVIVAILLISGIIGCHRVVEYPAAAACPVLATLPDGEVVDVPQAPSCPLPGPRPTPTLARSVETVDVIYAATMTVIDVERWADEADLYIACVNALPAGEP